VTKSADRTIGRVRCYTGRVRRTVAVVAMGLSAIVPAIGLSACSQDKVSAPTTTVPDETGIAAWLKSTYAGKLWTTKVEGSRTSTDGVVTVLTSLKAGDAANGVLMCLSARPWWDTAKSPITKLRIVSAAGMVLVTDDRSVDGCS
jgi:hypothetical protein